MADNRNLIKIADFLTEGIVILDYDFKVIFANKAARQILGIRKNKNQVPDFPEILHDKNDELKKIIMQAGSSHKDIHNRELTFIKNAKERRIVLTAFLVNRDSDLPHHSMILIITDVTKIWLMHLKERGLSRQLRDNYVDHMESLRQITDNIAHEVRNPIVSIGGYANYCLRKCAGECKDSKKITKYLTYIKEEAERLNRIVTMAESYSDMSEFHLKKENVVRLFSQLFKYGKRLAAKHNINAEFPIIEEEKYSMFIDYQKLYGAIRALMRNSILLSVKEAHLDISLLFTPYEVEITIEVVTDKISPDDLHFIFDPFYSVSDVKLNFTFASAQRIIILHGGVIKVNSSGRGTLFFIVSLPKEKRLSRDNNQHPGGG